MSNNEFKLIIYFIGDTKNGFFKRYKIFENIYDFNNNEITFINDSYDKKKYIEFQLISENTQKKYPKPIFKFFIYIGINKVLLY